MDRFHIIDEGVVVLRLRGKRFRQANVYRRGTMVYAAIGSEFVRLMARGNTSDPGVSWLEVAGDGIDLNLNGAPSFTS